MPHFKAFKARVFAYRMGLVQQHAPKLVREFEQRLSDALKSKEEKEVKKAERLAKKNAKAQVHPGPSLADYYPQVLCSLS